jgi:LuxR family maltose regulon positive regulatory protein
MIELYRAAVAKFHGDLEGNLAHARRVLEMVGESDHLGRGGAAAFLGLAYWEQGDLAAGERWYGEGMASLEQAGRIADLVGGAIVRADMRLAEGRLGDAMRIYEEGLELANRSRPPLRGVTDMHTGLAEVAYQRGRLDEAREHLEAARRSGEEYAFPRDPYRSRVVRARILQAEGDVDAAVTLLDEAERLYVSDFSPNVRPVSTIRARVLVAHGRLAEPRAWARRLGLSVTDDVSYLHESTLTTFARLLVAEASEADGVPIAPALELLDRLRTAAEEGRRDGSLLEILIVRALARQAAGDPAGALADLDAAIDLAAPDGYVRIFLDEGPSMVRLLKVAARRPNAAGHIHELLRVASALEPLRAPAQQGLIEPLSERELEVLRLLRSELDGPEMAAALFVSLNTLRTHTKNIYAKLGVGSRRAAIQRASELGLL